ncbi:GIY-YIG nuclease family protein [Paenibacillus sp. FSL H7-0940]|uniref:GIY-YIG nuclease family protein n=1 Tax=Paenibacillus sp. FSL H7-0940 TaxID=2921443 RepID=UPI0030EB9D91
MITIYLIINLINGKQYIGSTKNYRTRINKHKYMLRCGDHRNRYIQEDYDTFGEDSFLFSEIEVLNEEGDRFNREQFWMDEVKSRGTSLLYNILPVAGKARGRVHFESTKRKMSETAKGRKPSEATLMAYKEYRRNNPVPPETRAKMAATHRLRAKRGEDSLHAKLTEEQVIEILTRIKAGEQQKDIASEYGVAKSTLSHIWNGTTWSHIDRSAI